MNTRRRTLAAMLTLCAALTLLPGCEEKITAENYAQIKPGMSLYEVEKLLGGKGTKEDVGGVSIAASGLAGTTSSSFSRFVWKSGHAQISVDIKDGKVTTMGKSGL